MDDERPSESDPEDTVAADPDEADDTDHRLDFSLQSLVEACRDTSFAPVGKEMEFLYSRPTEFEEADLTYEGPLAAYDELAATVFHFALRFGLEYEARYPLGADVPWRDNPSTWAGTVPDEATEVVDGEARAVANDLMQSLIDTCRGADERELADELEYILAHPSEFERGIATEEDSTRPLGSYNPDASIVVHYGVIFGLLYERRYPRDGDTEWRECSDHDRFITPSEA